MVFSTTVIYNCNHDIYVVYYVVSAMPRHKELSLSCFNMSGMFRIEQIDVPMADKYICNIDSQGRTVVISRVYNHPPPPRRVVRIVMSS